MAVVTAASAFPVWQPHPEVWALVLGVFLLGVYVKRVIEPKAVAAGNPPITTAQTRWFLLGVALLWFASDWPLHDIAEERLYSAHMFQHMIITVMMPPAFLLAVPEWLGRLIIGDGRVARWFFRLARPVPAAILFNVMAGITHWAALVNLSVENGPFHYLVHTLFVAASLLIWTPVCGPFPELHLSPPGKMIYIFLMSIIPTFPAAFLTASDGVIYSSYDHGPRLWIVKVIHDQQFAGVVMKVIEGLYLWIIILVMFLKWMEGGAPKGKFRGTLVPTAPAPGADGTDGAEPADSGVPAEPAGSSSR